MNATENSNVKASTRLFTLKDTDYSANYNALLRQRSELEETLLELLTIQRDGAYVYTSYNEEYQEYGGRVDVVTGLENSTYVQIKSGLSVGDTVYYTEQESAFGSFSAMPGGMDFGGMGGGQMPDFGGEMPDFSGGGRPGGSGNGGGFPGGFGG